MDRPEHVSSTTTAPTGVNTVFVVDDDEGVRTSLGILLDSAGYRPMACSSAPEFLAQYDPARPGCLLLDMRMPGMNGMELLRELAGRGAFLPVIFITGHGDVPMAVEAMKGGAFDFLQKPFSQHDLLDRVSRALAADAEARQTLLLTEELRRRHATLTPREREVMALIVAGHANKVIAMDLKLSERTVEIHRARVMEKMATRSVAHLVRMAMALDGPGQPAAGPPADHPPAG
jgi:FixJ family two-component response regulator